MNINTKVRLTSFFYLPFSFAISMFMLALVADFIFNGSAAEIWKGTHTFFELLVERSGLYLNFSALGAICGLIYWFFYKRKYQYRDPLDKYFK